MLPLPFVCLEYRPRISHNTIYACGKTLIPCPPSPGCFGDRSTLSLQQATPITKYIMATDSGRWKANATSAAVPLHPARAASGAVTGAHKRKENVSLFF